MKITMSWFLEDFCGGPFRMLTVRVSRFQYGAAVVALIVIGFPSFFCRVRKSANGLYGLLSEPSIRFACLPYASPAVPDMRWLTCNG